MRKHRSYPVEFKRQVAQEFLAGETLHGLAKRHEINRNLVRIWVAKYEAGSFDSDVVAAEMVQTQRDRPTIMSRRACRSRRPGSSNASKRFAPSGLATAIGG